MCIYIKTRYCSKINNMENNLLVVSQCQGVMQLYRLSFHIWQNQMENQIKYSHAPTN